MTDLFRGWLNLQKKHLKIIHVELIVLCYRTVLCYIKREFTVRRRVKKINLSDLFLNSSQKGEKLKKVTEKKQINK